MRRKRVKRARPPRRGHVNVVQVGLKRHRLGDLYHLFLEVSWVAALAILAAMFVAVNVAFALSYLACGDCVAGARPGSFADVFFFSIHTIATIGYGTMSPRGTVANLLVALEAFTGLLGLAIVTGLVFAKFSRPTARVRFSKVAVIEPRNGQPCLMFRMANERTNRIVEAQVHVALARNEITAEGERIRRWHDLALERERSPLFAISWTVIHPITETSPLYGATPEWLAGVRGEIVVSMTGLDETFSQTIHARHSYPAADIVPNARFVDILSAMPDGTPIMDYTHFDEWVPLESGRTTHRAERAAKKVS